MLRFLRKKENVKKIMWALAILIIPAFVLWGSGSSEREKGIPKYAGKIFGQKVSFSQYEEALAACRNQALLIYGENFNTVAKLLNLDERAWEHLILLSQAKKEKIKVQDEEVIDFIQRLPFLQKKGRFDQAVYERLLEYVFRTPARNFEEQIREMLKIDKLRERVISKVSVSAEEIEQVYKNEYEKAKAQYVFIDPQKFTEQIQPAYEELKNYYQSHQAEFTKLKQVNVEYIALYFDQAKSTIAVSEEEIQNYYQAHPEQFSSKDKQGKEATKPLEEVKAQIKETLNLEKAKALLEQKIWQIAESIGEGPMSLAELAQKNQLEVKESGFFGPQDLVAEIGLSYEFLNTAFNLKMGQISNPIATAKGYFIIQLKDKKEAYLPALEELKAKVEQAVVKQKSWQLAKEAGEKILAQMKKLMSEEKLDFGRAAEKLSLTLKETEEFSRSSYIAEIGQSENFAQAAFAQKPQEISDLIAVPNGYCILSLKNIIPIDQAKFAQEKEAFAQQLLAGKKMLFFKTWLSELKTEAHLIDYVKDLRRAQ